MYMQNGYVVYADLLIAAMAEFSVKNIYIYMCVYIYIFFLLYNTYMYFRRFVYTFASTETSHFCIFIFTTHTLKTFGKVVLLKSHFC